MNYFTERPITAKSNVTAHVNVSNFMKATESNICRTCQGHLSESALRQKFGMISSNCIPDSITGTSRCPYTTGKA